MSSFQWINNDCISKVITDIELLLLKYYFTLLRYFHCGTSRVILMPFKIPIFYFLRKQHMNVIFLRHLIPLNQPTERFQYKLLIPTRCSKYLKHVRILCTPILPVKYVYQITYCQKIIFHFFQR